MLFAVLFLASMFLLSDKSVQVMKEIGNNNVVTETKKVIVIDAGHGGADPGKVGINGALEKDINLKIAQELERILTDSGFEVVLTRSSDEGLYST